MAVITLDQLRERHQKLNETREHEQREHDLRQSGYSYVLGELELMIKELEQREQIEQREPDPIDQLARELASDPAALRAVLDETGTTPDS